MWMSKRTRGAVSVFLVIILVPCIIATSLFVDIGRKNLSKSMADSASDLALNSLLANYDSVLNDWYGMAASCQDIETFITESENYFIEALKSANLSEDEIYGFLDDISHSIGTDKIDIADLLQIECQTEAGNIITPVSGANLTDPTLLKEQIVEFMKYRGPADLTESLIKRLVEDVSLNDAREAEANKPLVEAKENYYNTLGELIKSAFNTYWMIRNYFPLPFKQEITESNISNLELEAYARMLTGYKKAYSKMHLIYIACLMNTKNLRVYERVTEDLDKYTDEYTYENTEIYTEKKTQDGVATYYINGKRIREILEEAETRIDEFNEEKEAFCQATSELMVDKDIPAIDKFSIDDLLNENSPYYNYTNQIQWWLRMNKAVNAGNNSITKRLRTTADGMMKAYAKLLAIQDSNLHTSTTGDEPIPEDWENTAIDYMITISDDIHKKYLAVDAPNPGNADQYLYAVKTLENISKANEDAIKPGTYTVETAPGVSVKLDSVPEDISQNMKSIYDRLKELIGYLDIAINGHRDDIQPKSESDRVVSLDSLVELATEVKLKLDTWSDTANESTTEMGEEDRAEIEEINRDLSNNITAEAVGVLKNRLVNIKNQLERVANAVDSMEYCGKKVKNISSYEQFCNALKDSGSVSADGVPLTNRSIYGYACGIFQSCFVPNPEPDEPVIELGNTNNPDYDPTLYPVDKRLPDSGKVKTPPLYSFFHKQFKDANPKEMQDTKTETQNAKDEANNVAKNAKDKGRFHGDEGSCILKDFSGNGEMTLLGDGFATLVDFFKDLVNLDLTSIRDDTYVTDYIMKMFSYGAHETEGLYSLCDEDVKIGLKLPIVGTGYYPPVYDNYRGDEDAEDIEANKGKWLSELPRDHYNKSLTNKMINAASDTAYGAEVEYILFGKTKEKGKTKQSDNEANVKKAYTKIFEVRYALNLISGYANFWIPRSDNLTSIAVDDVALAVMSASCGIIPIPVTKIVLIPILTAFETAKDLDRLEAGFPVEIYKTADKQWWTAISVSDVKNMGKFMEELGSLSTKDNNGKGLFYSDYLTAFVYMGIKGTSAGAIYQRLAEVMQSNMRRATGNEKYSMKNARLYFKLYAEISVKPLMLTLPIVKNNGYEFVNDGWRTYKIDAIRGY